LPRGAGKIPQALRAFVPRAEERSARDLAVRIKVAAAQAQHSHDWPSRMRRMKDRAEILLDNVFRPLTVPATGGFLSAIVVLFWFSR